MMECNAAWTLSSIDPSPGLLLLVCKPLPARLPENDDSSRARLAKCRHTSRHASRHTSRPLCVGPSAAAPLRGGGAPGGAPGPQRRHRGLQRRHPAAAIGGRRRTAGPAPKGRARRRCPGAAPGHSCVKKASGSLGLSSLRRPGQKILRTFFPAIYIS